MILEFLHLQVFRCCGLSRQVRWQIIKESYTTKYFATFVIHVLHGPWMFIIESWVWAGGLSWLIAHPTCYIKHLTNNQSFLIEIQTLKSVKVSMLTLHVCEYDIHAVYVSLASRLLEELSIVVVLSLLMHYHVTQLYLNGFEDYY